MCRCASWCACCNLLVRWVGCPWLPARRADWSAAPRLPTAQCAWLGSSLSIAPWRAMLPRLLLWSVAAVPVGSCLGDCEPLRVRSLVHVDVTSRSWMRALVSLGWTTRSVALTAPQGVRTRFTGRLVIVTGATVSTTLLLHTAVGDWAWMRLGRSNMQLLRTAASFHCPVVSSVGWGCPCRDVACSSVIRLMLLGSTGVSLRAHRAVTRLLVSGRGCGCVRLLCSCR